MTKFALFLILALSSTGVWARQTAIGSYAITPQGRLGVISSKIAHNNTLVVSFHDRQRRTVSAENHPVARLSLTVERTDLASGTSLYNGDFIALKSDAQGIYETLAVFEDGRVLARPIAERLNENFQAKERDLHLTQNVERLLATKNSFNQFLLQVNNDVISGLWQLDNNFNKVITCIEQQRCNFVIRHRRLTEVTGAAFERGYAFHDFEINDKATLIDLLRQQALQYKLYTALSNADKIAPAKRAFPNALSISLAPAKGLTPIPFRPAAPELEFAQEYVRSDIHSNRLFMQVFLATAGIQETHPQDMFGRSRVCNGSGCYENSHFHDFVMPLYQMMAREIAHSQPFVAFLNWKLDEADILQALKRAVKESKAAQDFIAGLEGDARLILLSFNNSVENQLKKIDADQKKVIVELARLEEVKKQDWVREVFVEIKKPQFWGVLACYGVSVFTPIKWAHLTCHAAGIAVTAHSVFAAMEQTSALSNLNHLHLINPDLYRHAMVGLAVESLLGLFYLRVALPDFKEPLRRLTAPTARPATQVGAANLNALLHNPAAVASTRDHIVDVLKKLLAVRLFITIQNAEPLLSLFLTPDTHHSLTYQGHGDFSQENLITVTELMSRVMLSQQFSLLTGRNQEFTDSLRRHLEQDRSLRLKMMDLLKKIYQ